MSNLKNKKKKKEKKEISNFESLVVIPENITSDEKEFNLKEQNIDFKNKQLNDLVININKLADELKDNVFVQKNKEWSFIVEKNNSEYLNKVYQNHKNLPKNRMSSGIVSLILGAMFLGMAGFLPSIINDLRQSAGVVENSHTQLTTALHEAMTGMTSLMSTMMYVVGTISIMVGIVRLGGAMQGNEIIEEDKVKEKIENVIEENNFKITKNIHFENKELDNLVSKINTLASELHTNEIVSKNAEWSFLVEKSKTEYIERIYKNYMNLPKNKKNQENIGEAKKQLTLVLDGLLKVENNLEKEIQKMQKANEHFLNEKVKSIGEY